MASFPEQNHSDGWEEGTQLFADEVDVAANRLEQHARDAAAEHLGFSGPAADRVNAQLRHMSAVAHHEASELRALARFLRTQAAVTSRNSHIYWVQQRDIWRRQHHEG